MKKIFTLLAMAMMMVSTALLTSCTEDQMVGMTLSGTWEGDMYVSSRYNGKLYRASYTELEFSQDPFRTTTGSGYWVDYYSGAPWDYVASHIRWTVRNGIIEVYFIEDQYTAYISEYKLSDYRFTGYIDDGYSSDKYFSLRKTRNNDWDDFDYGYDYWYGRSASRASADSDNNETAAVAERPQRIVGAE